MAHKFHDEILFGSYHLHENNEAFLNDSNLLFLLSDLVLGVQIAISQCFSFQLFNVKSAVLLMENSHHG